LGALTLYNNSIGCSNLAAGYCSLNSNTSGSYNTAVGYYSSLIGNFTNTTTLGYWASTTADNQVRIGNSSVTSIGGQVAWTALSDARIKENIRQNVPGLDFVMQLKPVTYNLNKDKADSIIGISDSAQYKEKYEINTVLQTGFIAQDVENAAQSLGYDFCGIDKSGVENGGLYGLRYSVFVVPLVKATQEQQLIIEQQQEIIENLLIRIESLEKRINALDNQ
jgi:hypothetical protein